MTEPAGFHVTHQISFPIQAYTGLDMIYYVLPERYVARKVAKRTGYHEITLILPSGNAWHVKDGVATRAERPELPPTP